MKTIKKISLRSSTSSRGGQRPTWRSRFEIAAVSRQGGIPRNDKATGFSEDLRFMSGILACCMVFLDVPAWAAEKKPIPVSIQTSSSSTKQTNSNSTNNGAIAAYLSRERENAAMTAREKEDLELLAQEAKSTWLQTVKIENNRFTLTEGRSHFMRFSTRIARISVSNPAILDFLTLSSSEILLNAKTNGSVNLMVWDMAGNMSSFDINVIRDPGLLDKLLKQIDPKGEFEIFPSRDVFVVRGFTSSVQKQKYVEDAVKSFAPGSVSLVRIKEIRQILLQIRFVQIDHGRDYDFGLDLQRFANGNKHISAQTFAPGGTNAVPNTDASLITNPKRGTFTRTFEGLLSEDGSDEIAQDIYQLVYQSDNNMYRAFLKAKEAEGIAKVIARPNLLAKDGEEASFVVGGESAIAISTNNQLTVQYKEFGTSLKYKPEIMEDGEISLTIEPEVSQLNSANGVEINNFNIPGFSKTKIKTVVQLKDGETLLIGGMIQQTMSTSDTGAPFLRRIPILGKIFQSTNHDWQETELLIIVTPKIIKPERSSIGDNDPKDVLARATNYLEPAIPLDVQASSIKYYLDKNKRWAELEEMEKELQLMELTQRKATTPNKEVALP